MIKPSYHLWLVAFLLGWAADFLFWKQTIGINVAIFISLCLLCGYLLLHANGIRPARKSLWLVIPGLFFAVMACIRREPLTLALSLAFGVLPVGILAVTYLGGRWMRYGLLDYFQKLGQLVASIAVRGMSFFLAERREQAASAEGRKPFPILPVVRGLLIAFPIVGGFTYLLANGDMVFNQKLLDFRQDHLTWKQLSENFQQLMIILFAGYGMAGVLLHAASRSFDEKLLGEDRPVIKPLLGFTETAIVLGSIAALFFSFVMIQFQYFFGGSEIMGAKGYTYSQYARSGFNELVMVAFLSLVLTLGLNILARRETETQRRIYSGLCVAILAMVGVILVSAWQRLSLAIDWHGYSRLRVYPRVFLIWVGILFLVVVVLEILRRERYFAFAAVLASLGFTATLCLMNVDAEIVRYNVVRATQLRYFNVNHLTTLSTDAIPALVKAFQDKHLPEEIHEGIGAALNCYIHYNQHYDEAYNMISNDSTQNWRSLNISRWQAGLALDSVQPALQDYYVDHSVWPAQVRTPGKVLYSCEY